MRTGAGSDPDFAAASAAAVAAGGALVDCGVSDPEDAGVEFAGAASEAVEPRPIIAGANTAPCPSCVLALVAPAPTPTAAVPVLDAPVLDVPATGDEPGEYFLVGLGECATLILRLPRSSGLKTAR